MPSKRNRQRKKVRLAAGEASDPVKPSAIAICLSASVAMLRKAESRNLEAKIRVKSAR